MKALSILVTALLVALALPAAADAPHKDLTITAVGDVRITSAQIRHHAEQLRRIRLKGDLVFANFEGVIGDSTPADPWKFTVPRTTIEMLRAMGINALGVANNHALDLDEKACRDTIAALTEAGFCVAGLDRPEAAMTVESRHLRLLTYSFSSSRNNVNRPQDIPAAFPKTASEIIVVSAHMGGENRLANWIPAGAEYFGDEPRGNVVEFSHRCIDAGADLVLGHGPHVPRGLEIYKNKLIVYSLGNFAFDYPGAAFHPHAPGFSISVRLNEDGDFRSAHINSYDLQSGIPVLDLTGLAYRIIRDLTYRNLMQHRLTFPGNGSVEIDPKEKR